ncbi:MAG: hypothetical protein AAGF20_07545 [Pseudomonadota bacterium]
MSAASLAGEGFQQSVFNEVICWKVSVARGRLKFEPCDINRLVKAHAIGDAGVGVARGIGDNGYHGCDEPVTSLLGSYGFAIAKIMQMISAIKKIKGIGFSRGRGGQNCKATKNNQNPFHPSNVHPTASQSMGAG